MLGSLYDKLEAREQRDRNEAFQQAHKFVDRSAELGGLPQNDRYPMCKSYPQPPRSDKRRVDVEIRAGRAFAPDPGGAP